MEFYNNYKNNILPKYGSNRDSIVDSSLLEIDKYPYQYSIENRLNLEHVPSYSIDPEGCEDADDAFSIYNEGGELYLAIHIADPTHYIQLNSPLWKNILERTVTRYPSNYPPIHLMPKDIVDKSSLMENRYGSHKNAISVIIEISPITYQPINNVRICYTQIIIPKSNNLSYNTASKLIPYDTETSSILRNGLLIANSLKQSRNTLGKKINNHLVSNIKYIDSKPVFVQDNPIEKSMKEMIAEFAIFANTIVGKYLTYHLNGMGLYRTCESKEWLDTLDNTISGKDLMNKIIDNGISANYQSKVLSHDLVGSDEYCHFTSPIRRVSDCVCHYLLKYIFLSSNNKKLEIPFSELQLSKISGRCQSLTKYMRKIQFNDKKFRTIETIYYMVKKNPIQLKIRFVSYSGLFLNFIITEINDDEICHKISISYSLRIKKYNYTKYWISNPEAIINITSVNLPGNFDEKTLPELDHFIKNPL